MNRDVLSRRDVHREITDTIAAAIEAGAKDYMMPWHQSVMRPLNAATGKSYHGVNVVVLWAAGRRRDFRSGYWATYRQWAGLEAQVRKGERGSMVVFYKSVEVERDEGEEGAQSATTAQTKLVARASWVFNADQVNGWSPPALPAQGAMEIRENAEAFIAATRADIRHGGDMAYYDPAGDFIAVPHAEQFTGTKTSTATESYYSVILHELTHWAGAPTRLARNLRARFGDHAYAMEELIAELGAAFLCADLCIANEPRLDHAAYVSSWLQLLKDDRTALFSAASKASVAATFLAELARCRAKCAPAA